MRKWRVTPIGAAFVALVLLVLLFVLRGALHHPTRVVLPQEKSSTEDDGLSLDDNSAGRVTVRPDTVQSAVATLARPACYTRSITIERYYTGGSGVDSPQLTKFLFGKGPVIFIGRQFAGCGKGGEGGDHVLALSF